MVTSRERLNVAGEVVQLVEPLPLDGPAIELFVARARGVRHDFAPDDAQRTVVAEIVRLLDGLPLAIELAAARIAVLSPSQLLLRLRDRFALLTGRRGASRQATLRAAIDWSWQLLSAWEQSAFEQCSVFEGGFTLAAAEAVIDLSAWPEAPPVVDAMQALRRQEPAAALGARRRRRRATSSTSRTSACTSASTSTRPRSAARAAATTRTLQLRHGRFFAAFGTDEAIEALSTHGGMQRQQALRRELDNLLAACRRAITRADGEIAVACYRAAWEVLALQGPFGVAVALGDEVVAMPGSISAWRNGAAHASGGADARRRHRRAGGQVGAGARARARASAIAGSRGASSVGSATSACGKAGSTRRMRTTPARSKALARSAIGCSRRACTATSRSRASRAGSPRRGRGALRGGARDRTRDRQSARRSDHALQPRRPARGPGSHRPRKGDLRGGAGAAARAGRPRHRGHHAPAAGRVRAGPGPGR